MINLKIYFLLFKYLLILSVAKKSQANEINRVEFEILEYVNSEGRLLNGNCCSGYKSSGLCRGGNATCRSYWKICLTNHHYQNNLNNVPIIIPTERQKHRYQTTPRPFFLKNVFSKFFAGYSSGKNKVNDSNSQAENTTETCSISFWTTKIIRKDTDFPIVMKSFVSEKRLNKLSKGNANQSIDDQLKRVLILIEIWHSQNSESDKLIYRYVETKNITNGSDWQVGGKSTNGIQFKYKWRVSPSSLSDLAETITTQNSNICPSGWKGENCKEPICLEGCDVSHGYCEEPGQCQCRFGWTGALCNYCMTMPGCIHGTCVRPLECKCEDGWTGMFCSTPKCKVGCHPTNGFCSVPGECKCRFGWQGENCTQCSTLPGCQHGGCNEPLDCNCFYGWEGMFCSTPKCSNGCDVRQGWCRRPDECRCKVGFKGENCTECVPYPGCQHGNCDGTPWTCLCQLGWGGLTCSERLDWCEKNDNPCQNGGTCIGVEQAEGGYYCQCVLGYTGKHCEKLKN